MWLLGGWGGNVTDPHPAVTYCRAGMGANNTGKSCNMNDVWSSRDGAAWSQLTFENPGNVWDPRHAMCTYVLGDTLWIAAGNDWDMSNRHGNWSGSAGTVNEVWGLTLPHT